MRVLILLMGAAVFGVIFALGIVTFIKGYTNPVLPPPTPPSTPPTNEENDPDV